MNFKWYFERDLYVNVSARAIIRIPMILSWVQDQFKMEDCFLKKKRLLNVTPAMTCVKTVVMDRPRRIATTVNMPKLNKSSGMLSDELLYAKMIINVHKHIIWMIQNSVNNVVLDAIQNSVVRDQENLLVNQLHFNARKKSVLRTWRMCCMFFNHYPTWLSAGFRGSKLTALSTFLAG